jgi:hypothetical protein
MKKILATLALVLVALGAQAQNAYPLFAPSNGIMVGNTNTYITTSATGPNVVSLFSGTCNAAAFLRGDASCFDLFGTANTWSQPQTLTFARTNANSPFLLSSTTTAARWNETDGAVDNKQWEWAANAEQFRLGLLTDAGALGGSVFLIDRTGTVVDSIAMAATTVTVNGQNVCRADGTGCPGGITGLANPTASLGLAAVNGAATTAMRSDAAPALSQAIAPTWTNTHIFANNGANATFIGNDPRFNFSESDGALDEKNWIVRSVASGFNVSTASDAAPFSAVNSAITVPSMATRCRRRSARIPQHHWGWLPLTVPPRLSCGRMLHRLSHRVSHRRGQPNTSSVTPLEVGPRCYLLPPRYTAGMKPMAQ